MGIRVYRKQSMFSKSKFEKYFQDRKREVASIVE